MESSASPCAELHEISVLLFILVWVVLTFAFGKFVVWLATSMGESSWRAAQSRNTDTKNEGSTSFAWRGNEAEEAYREKHWGSYEALRLVQEQQRESQIRRDERAKNRGL